MWIQHLIPSCGPCLWSPGNIHNSIGLCAPHWWNVEYLTYHIDHCLVHNSPGMYGSYLMSGLRGAFSSLEICLLVLRMLSLLRVVTTPITLKLSPPSHARSPHSPLGKHATFTAVLADASNSPVGDPPLQVALCHLNGVYSLTADTQRLPFLTRALPACEVDKNTIANPDASPNTTSHSNFATYPCAIFPVYGPFDLLYCVQTGGFGAAWAAKDRSTGRLLCLKVFQSSQDSHVSRSVRAEITTFRRLVKSERGEKGKQFIMELNRSFQHGADVFFAMVSPRLSLTSNQLSINFRNS